MSDLSEAARSLIREGHAILRPSLDDRARVAVALASRLPEGVLVATTAATFGAATSRWVVWQKVSGLVLGAGLLGGGATWALRQPESLPPPPSVTHETAPVTAEVPAAPAPESVADAPSVEPPSRPSPGAVQARPGSDRLAEEVSLLSKAAAQLRSGQPGDALRLLNEHQRRFPSGRLVEERRAARIQALCALGNRGAAEAELSQLARSSPRSPHVARARQACGLPPSSG